MCREEPAILVVSNDASFWVEARRVLEAGEGGARVAVVSTIDAAHRILDATAPGVILLEAAGVEAEKNGPPGKELRLDAAVSSLATRAPVVVIGPAEREEELTALVAAGVVDYVALHGQGLREAAKYVEQRLQGAKKMNKCAERIPESSDKENNLLNREDFGEVLRHELNNPLTGILGNAELLLAEMRRKNDGHIPRGGQQRLETIATLAVRLRETVRRLSEQWELQRDALHLK